MKFKKTKITPVGALGKSKKVTKKDYGNKSLEISKPENIMNGNTQSHKQVEEGIEREIQNICNKLKSLGETETLRNTCEEVLILLRKKEPLVIGRSDWSFICKKIDHLLTYEVPYPSSCISIETAEQLILVLKKLRATHTLEHLKFIWLYDDYNQEIREKYYRCTDKEKNSEIAARARKISELASSAWRELE